MGQKVSVSKKSYESVIYVKVFTARGIILVLFITDKARGEIHKYVCR